MAPTTSAVNELEKVGLASAMTVQRLLEDEQSQATLHEKVLATSTVHRILGKHGLHRLPANQKHRAHATRWRRYEKPQPGHRLQLDVKFLERIPGTRTRLYEACH